MTNALIARTKKIQHYIELDDIDSFRLLGVSRKEIQNLIFNFNMNILQLVVFEEAIRIFDYLTRFMINDSILRINLGKHRDSHMGSQAIHLAAASGNRNFI